MVVPRTPRPPIIAPKPVQRLLDASEIERWVARLARAIRLSRVEQRFLGAQSRSVDNTAGLSGGANGEAPERR
jgi:hypothetical protein